MKILSININNSPIVLKRRNKEINSDCNALTLPFSCDKVCFTSKFSLYYKRYKEILNIIQKESDKFSSVKDVGQQEGLAKLI